MRLAPNGGVSDKFSSIRSTTDVHTRVSSTAVHTQVAAMHHVQQLPQLLQCTGLPGASEGTAVHALCNELTMMRRACSESPNKSGEGTVIQGASPDSSAVTGCAAAETDSTRCPQATNLHNT